MKTKQLLKVTFFLFALFGLILSGCKKEDKPQPPITDGISDAQNSLLLFFSSNAMDVCGDYGTPARDAIISRTSGRPVVISCQLDKSQSEKDPLTNADAIAFATIFFGPPPALIYVPTMFVLGKNVGYFIADSANLKVPAESKIDSLNSLKADIGIKSTPNMAGIILTLSSKIKFFSDINDVHQVAVYLIENDVDGSQFSSSGWNYNVKHQGVLRGKLSNSITGDAFISSAKAGEIKEHVITGSINPAWNLNNLYAAIVIWKKVGNNYSVANCNIVKVK